MTKKVLGISLALILLVAGSVWFVFGDRIARVQVVSSLFTGAEQIDNFNRMHMMFPVTTMPGHPTFLKYGLSILSFVALVQSLHQVTLALLLLEYRILQVHYAFQTKLIQLMTLAQRCSH